MIKKTDFQKCDPACETPAEVFFCGLRLQNILQNDFLYE